MHGQTADELLRWLLRLLSVIAAAVIAVLLIVVGATQAWLLLARLLRGLLPPAIAREACIAPLLAVAQLLLLRVASHVPIRVQTAAHVIAPSQCLLEGPRHARPLVGRQVADALVITEAATPHLLAAVRVGEQIDISARHRHVRLILGLVVLVLLAGVAGLHPSCTGHMQKMLTVTQRHAVSVRHRNSGRISSRRAAVCIAEHADRRYPLGGVPRLRQALPVDLLQLRGLLLLLVGGGQRSRDCRDYERRTHPDKTTAQK